MMACGCAVVELASERFNGVLTHGQDSWLVQPNAQSAAEGIIKLLEEKPLREKLVENALRRTRKMNWANSARQIEAVLMRRA